jgi:hypothetical protein
VLLLRQQDRLLLAPLYGGGLLLVDELATRSSELVGIDRLGPGVLGARLGTSLVTSALGTFAACGVAAAVTIAPRRSVLVTAVGVAATLVMFGWVTWFIRRRATAVTWPTAPAVRAAGQGHQEPTDTPHPRPAVPPSSLPRGR